MLCKMNLFQHLLKCVKPKKINFVMFHFCKISKHIFTKVQIIQKMFKKLSRVNLNRSLEVEKKAANNFSTVL